MKISIIAFTLMLVIAATNAKTFGKCELAKNLDSLGFSRSSLPDWICLVKYESSFRTHVKGPMNEDGSYDWGLFQINDRYWCQVGRAGKSCNIDCKDLLKDNISQAAACAKQIFRAHGFYAWNAWKDYCNGKTLPSISECF